MRLRRERDDHACDQRGRLRLSMRILVYSMGEVIGDGLIKLPFAAGLRAAFPDAHIAWCAAKGETVYSTVLAPIVSGLIDEIIVATPTGAGAWDFLPWKRPFGGATFDLVIDTQENLRRSAFVRRAVGSGGCWVAPTPSAKDWPVALVERLTVLLDRALPGAKPQAITVADAAIVAEAARVLPQGQDYIGFAPGSGGAEKRWPLQNYIALAQRQARLGFVPVFLLGPQELDEAAKIAAAIPTARFPEAEAQSTLRGPALVVALAGRLCAAVANDAGPGHMLAAGGAPLLSLQRDARKAAKFKPAARRLEMLAASDYGDEMKAISIDAADGALQRLLGQGV